MNGANFCIVDNEMSLLVIFNTTYKVRAWSGTALLVGTSRDRFPVVSLRNFSVAPPDGTMCPGVDSAPEIEYQEFLLG